MQDLRNKRVALYARFSSAMQREASIADQLRRCREYVVSHGGVVDEGLVFSDAAMSGASLHRPGFERMMKLVESIPAGVNLIVTEDMSRISRDFADSAIIFRLLEYLRIPLIGVADGVDTSAKGAKLAFTMKSMFSDMYLDDLRDKTLRGLRGRALAGYSTGGLPLGYRSVQVKDAYDRIIGHRIEVDPETAPTVRRIFELYLEGRSLETITRLFNEERVPPARAKTRHRRKGWVSNTVRNILHNEAYIGVWNFGRRQWRKVPGTNCRRPCPGDPSEVIRREYPDRVIIDEATWTAAQNRLAEVRAVYVKSPDGKRKRGAVSGRQNSYPLSGILFCGECGAPMTIHGGTSANYYRCVDQKKRGTCSNKLSLREDVAKRRLLDTIEERYAWPKAYFGVQSVTSAGVGGCSQIVSLLVK